MSAKSRRFERGGQRDPLLVSLATQFAKPTAGEGTLDYARVRSIQPDPEQPRRHIITVEQVEHYSTGVSISEVVQDTEAQEQLESIRTLAMSIKSKGLAQPIVIYPQDPTKPNEVLLIAMGERRWLAHIFLGEDLIRAIIKPKRPGDQELRALQLIENLQRKELSPWELALGVRSLAKVFKERTGRTMRGHELAEQLGLGKSQAAVYLKVAGAGEDILEALRVGRLRTLDDAYAVAAIKDRSDREVAIKELSAPSPAKAPTATESDQSQASAAPPKPATRKQPTGRPSKRVDLGATENFTAIRKLIETLGAEAGIDTAKIDWSKPREVKRTWHEFWTWWEAQ